MRLPTAAHGKRSARHRRRVPTVRRPYAFAGLRLGEAAAVQDY